MSPVERPHTFRFKQFSVRHDRCSMKVGTDGVLLGAWTTVKAGAKRLLDIGTGSGVIALMLAQRTVESVVIDAIEIATPDAEQATDNVRQSPWHKKIHVVHTSLLDFHPGERYDLIVTNPPFFTNSTKPPSEERNRARHTGNLSHEELIAGVNRLLNTNGLFAVILPTTEGDAFEATARTTELYCSRKTAFYSRDGKPQERWLLEFTRSAVDHPIENSLVLYGSGDRWTARYEALVMDFYLGRQNDP